MKVIYTEQSVESLEELLRFLIEDQKLPIEKVVEIKDILLKKVDSLSDFPYKGQVEEYR